MVLSCAFGSCGLLLKPLYDSVVFTITDIVYVASVIHSFYMKIRLQSGNWFSLAKVEELIGEVLNEQTRDSFTITPPFSYSDYLPSWLTLW